MILNIDDKKYNLKKKSLIMGILNITEDSFYDGGKYTDIDKAVQRAVEIEKQGADIIDVGGESTRPFSIKIDPQKEINRVIPVIKRIKKKINIPISIDTYKSEVAEQALKAGASVINDISGFNFDEKMPLIAKKYNASVVLMHIKGTPQTMQKNPVYKNVIKEINDYLSASIKIALKNKIKKNKIIIDPGIGFGKRLTHNIEIFRNLDKIVELGYPVLLGASRKSFIDMISHSPVEQRLPGSLAALAAGVIKNINIFRVHDVWATKQFIDVFKKII